MNTLTLISEPEDTGEIRVRVFIDGEKKFLVAMECLEWCFLTRDPISGRSYLKDDLIPSSAEKVIDYGFCDEMCCPSTLAEIHFSPTHVRWSRIRPSTGDPPNESLEYVFDREAYDHEVSRCVAGMIRHLAGLHLRLRYPHVKLRVIPPEPH